MRPARLRRVQRLVHLLAAGVLLVYVYGPLDAELQDVVRLAIFPALVLTGIAMWQAVRIRRSLRRRRSTAGPYNRHQEKKEWTDASA